MDELWDDPIDDLIEESMDDDEEYYGDFPEDPSEDEDLYLECDSCGGNWYRCECPLDDTDLPF